MPDAKAPHLLLRPDSVDLVRGTEQAGRAVLNATLEVRGYAKRVAKGVRFCNETLPTWITKIELSDLELSDGNMCVLGQLAAKSAITSAGYALDERKMEEGSGYIAATAALDIKGFDYGFDIPSAGDDVGLGTLDGVETYALLNHLWAEAILRTRQGKKISASKLAQCVVVV